MIGTKKGMQSIPCIPLFRHPRASESICEARDERDTGIQVNKLRETFTYFYKNDFIFFLDSGSVISLTSSMKITVRNDDNFLFSL